MKRVRYDPKQFLTITEHGIRYIDGHGQTCWIDLAVFRSNWVRFVNETTEFPTTNLQENESRCVAWRDDAHAPPYIEFFMEQRTRFEFVVRGTLIERFMRRIGKRHQQVHRVQQAIQKAGWTSYDRS
jgi:hypothetical protein